MIIRLSNTQTVFQFENDFKHKDDWKTKNAPLILRLPVVGTACPGLSGTQQGNYFQSQTKTK